MPDHGLEGFRVRRDVRGVDGGDEDAGVGDGCGVASVAANDADDFRAHGFRILEGGDEVGADVLFEVAAADGEDQEQVVRARRRLVRSQLSKIEAQPSSLARAVSSETLSVGA